MNKTKIITVIIALVVGYGTGYFTPHSVPAAQTQTARGNFMGGARNGANGGFLSGTVAAKDSGSITLNTRDGSSHVVLVTPNTTVSKSVNGSQSDVTVGATVMVSGTTNGDRSVSANIIQLRPATPPATVGQ